MGDLISRQAAIEAVDAYLALSEVSKTVQNMTSLQDILKNLPPSQPEIIRCKDCKYSSDDEYCHCNRVTWWNTEEDYCSRGERREDEQVD